MKATWSHTERTRGGKRDYPVPHNEALPGEDSGSVLLEDAVHWVSVYGELVSFTRSLARDAASGDGHRRDGDLAELDVAGLDVDGLIGRYEERYDFWRRRARELAERDGH